MSLLVRGFEWGHMCFLRSRLFEPDDARTIADIWMNRPKKTFADQLADTLKKHSIRMLICHGVHDKVIPITQSERLAKEIPNVQLIRYDCGHVCNEEEPEKFLSDVIDFLQS